MNLAFIISCLFFATFVILLHVAYAARTRRGSASNNASEDLSNDANEYFAADCSPSAGFIWSKGLTLPIAAKLGTQVSS
jgi:hypothetical protein